MSLLTRGSSDEKYRYVFDIWDEDKDGRLDRDQYFQFFFAMASAPTEKVALVLAL